MKKYMSVTVAYNPKKQDPFEVQRLVENALEERFPSFEADGGGMPLVWEPAPKLRERDVFFDINYSSVDKVIPHLKKKGFKVF